MVDTNVIQALLAKLTDLHSTVAATDALQKAQRVGTAILEIKIRLRVLKMMRARGVDIENEDKILTWVKTHEGKLDVAEEDIIAQQVEAVAATLGVTADDEKATRNHRRRIERKQREANGECVDCPKKKVRRAAPGSTRCEKCGKAHSARNRTYRKQTKTQMSDSPGARTPPPSAEASGDAAGAAGSTHQAEGRLPFAQSRSDEPAGDASANTPRANPQLPFLTRTKQ